MKGRGNTSECPGLSHHVYFTPERAAYYDAWRRCTNPKVECYTDYGARGIKFSFTSFSAFLREIGPRPSSRHRLDRIDNDGHYEPGNVRWSTPLVSTTNRRKFRGGSSLLYRGVSRHRAKWQAQVKIPNPSGKGEGKPLYIGTFSSEVEAYDAKARELFGADALLNFP